MKLNLKIVVLLLFFSPAVFAQSKKIKGSGGTWTFTQYAPNIIKASFQPSGYVTNENVSDAVILKPLKQLAIPVSVKGNVAYIGVGDKVKINEPVKKDAFNSFQIALSNSEKIFGGGERALPLNRRGYKFNLYNNPSYGYGEGTENLNYSVPFFTTSDGYGLFFDNPSKGYADIGKTDSSVFEAGFVSGELNVYIIFGKDYKTILSSYYKLTGTQPLPPRWALGNFMSRFGYSSEAETKSILDSMHQQNIPVDAIIFDLFWFGDSIKSTMGNLAWVNKTKWPNPANMISDFKKQHVNTVLITEPFVLQSSLNYEASKKYHAVDSAGNPFVLTDFYFGRGGLIDIFRKDAQDWFWSKYDEQMKIGVEGWWGDLGEPERHPQGIYHNLNDLGFKRLFKADEVHNIYGHEWTKMLYQHYAKEYPDKRLFSLNRSGFAGTQRYGIFPWTGDVSRSWTGLRAQLPVILGMSMSGVPYVHSDAGGFAGGDGDNELYVRWLQFAAFTPIFRPHGTDLTSVDKAPFSFPSEAALIDEPYRSYAKNAIALRYSLLPYNYTLAYEQSKNGKPLIAPLYYYYPKDTTAINVSDEFMWGEDILVAPVLHKGDSTRQVYLPEGKWYPIFDTSLIEGSKWVNKKLRIDAIPLYIKEGSIIPMWSFNEKDSISSTANYNSAKDIAIMYYPSEKKSTFIFYDDDGVSKVPHYDIIRFDALKKDGKVIINISSQNKEVTKIVKSRQFKIRVFQKGTRQKFDGLVNGKKADWVNSTLQYFFYDNVSSQKLSVNFTGKPMQLEINLDKPAKKE